MKNRKAYYLLFATNIISGFAQGISMLAIPWHFATVLKQPEAFGKTYAITTIAMMFVGLYAGSLIDKYSRKHVFLGVNIFGFLLLSAAALSGFIAGDVPSIFILSVFAGTILIFNFHYPALYAFGQEITERQFYGKFTSLIEILGQSTSILAGAAAAILLSGLNYPALDLGFYTIPFSIYLEPWSMRAIFLLDACTYAIGIALIALIKYTPVVVRVAESGNVFQRINRGLDYLKKNPLVFLFGNFSFAIFAVLLITVQQLLPVYTDKHLQAGAGMYAILEVMYALGALMAGIGVERYFRNKGGYVNGVRFMLWLTVIIYLIYAFSTQRILILAITFLLGIANAGARVLRTTWLFQHVENQQIGRVSSVFQTINIILRFLLSLVFAMAFFNTADGIRWSYLICGFFVFINLLGLMRFQKQITALKKEHH